MPYVRTFDGFAPPKRGDGFPFTIVRIHENSVPVYATAVLIQSITLTPVDTDPSRPISRVLTTTLATIAQDGWYWLVWEDASGSKYIGDPVQVGDPTLSNIEILVRSEMPLTWDGLVNTTSLGISTLRLRIANVKASILPAAVAAQSETTYSNALIAYICKRAALDLIPTGIEFWMRQKVTLSATGTNENKSLPDPIGALRELAKRLMVEVENLAGNPDVLIYSQIVGEAPAVSLDGDLITANPYEWDPAFETDETTASQS